MSCGSDGMIVELGHFALVLAFSLAAIQFAVPLAGTQFGDSRLAAVAGPAATMCFLLTTLSFVALTSAYVQSDFSVANVWANSHSAKPMLFKITGVWGNHEGSMLLWVLILTLFGALVAWFSNNLPPTLRANVLSVQGLIAAAFLLFILTTSDPFIRINPAPVEGEISIRYFRTSASRYIRHFFTWVMLASRFASALPLLLSLRERSTLRGRAGFGHGRSLPGYS